MSGTPDLTPRQGEVHIAGASIHPLTAPRPNEDQQTGRDRIREADAAHAKSSPFLSAISGRYISDGENRRLFSL